jgi:hypothetical protein
MSPSVFSMGMVLSNNTGPEENEYASAAALTPTGAGV